MLPPRFSLCCVFRETMPTVEDKKKYLAYLLQKEQWTPAEKQWMLTCLYDGDMDVLREIAREQYHNDLQLVEDVIDQQLSSSLLDKLHEKMEVLRVKKIVNLNLVNI